MTRRRILESLTTVAAVGLLLTACGSSSGSGTETPSSQNSTTSEVPQVDAGSFTADFSVMKQLTDLAAQGKGMIGVLLPDTTTSTRYVQYDKPYLTQAFEAAGLTSDDFKIDNADGSAATMQTQAEADINAGASVLLVDPLDAGSGAAIEAKAEAAGLAVIDYDRLVTGGPENRYYVSFDNVKVGKLMGEGLVQCIKDWNVSDPNVLIMDGDPTDHNASMFAEGYKSVLKPLFDDGTYTKVGEPAGTWDPQQAATTFQQQLTAHPEMNAAITPNDDNANAVISILKSNGVDSKTFPTTGQDASLPGLKNILTGYQCGTVYKPIYLEAQAAAALAIYLRAGVTPPDTLVNATTKDTEIGADIPSVYTTPIWVTTENMAKTVVADKTVTVDDLCSGDAASACDEAGIG
ncbi:MULTISPECIES: sugar ABC transporter substrate-binding protein [unclassified Pseudactinotalea]|uniref:sugar ABC transporter substrate-binding protein n=1 Tax=unclassified Pseudactinotalea TaxID=2649176 RepID=UPI00128C519C|nr:MULTISPECIES: substrate-binding domain-containing protein [unclassified Pseudactinotalea]MPV50394.1 substrate-binding domain-containing protein [Pseudactinotalea sp. HY160]QGH68990.1 substrate-binding domain-containing protein [Pseudactinotalea sp. HY158]